MGNIYFIRVTAILAKNNRLKPLYLAIIFPVYHKIPISAYLLVYFLFKSSIKPFISCFIPNIRELYGKVAIKVKYNLLNLILFKLIYYSIKIKH